MNLQETAHAANEWLKRQDPFGLAVATALMVPDIGHAGKLFADREVAGYGQIGHILAGCIDAVFVIAFRKAAKTKHLPRRIYAVFVAVMACVVNGAFNVAYYRDSYTADPFVVSLTLGASAPVLAALLSILQAFDKKERLEQEQADTAAGRADGLERFRIEQTEITKRQVAVEAEKTKQIRAQTRAEQARIQAEAVKEEAEQRQHQDELDKVLAELGKSGDILAQFLDNPTLTQAEAAQALGLSRQTVGYHLSKLEDAGIIKRNGQGVEVLVEFDKQEEET